MKTKSLHVPIPLPPFLCLKLRAHSRAPIGTASLAANVPPSAYRVRWPHAAPLRRSDSPHGGGGLEFRL